MFKIELAENAQAALILADKSLASLLDGEYSYSNYRNYVVNLHNSLELFFKKMLFDYNDFMIFSFNNYGDLINKYKRAYTSGKTIFELVGMNDKEKLPHTVSFKDAVCRLAYLLKNSKFSIDYIEKLEKLDALRNNIIHFEIEMEDDQFTLLNELYLKAHEYNLEMCFNRHESISDINEIKNKNLTIQEAAVREPFNNKLLRMIKEDGTCPVDFEDYATLLVMNNIIKEEEKDKVIERLNILYNLGLITHSSYGDENYDVDWFYLSDLCEDLLNEN